MSCLLSYGNAQADEGGQKQYLSSLNSKLHQIESENSHLKEAKKEWELKFHSHYTREQELSDEINKLNGQLEAARRERESVQTTTGN